MRYRDHKGDLKESLETTQEFKTIDELKTYLNSKFDNIEEIDFKYVGMDQRIGWNSYYVFIRLKEHNVFNVVGISDGKF